MIVKLVNRVGERIWSRVALIIALISMLIAAGIGYIYISSEGGKDSENLIGLISIDGSITSYDDVSGLTSAIDEATHDSSIKAVVLNINSPGGVSHLIEQVYLDLLVLKNVKPVVVYTSMALSGGYYISVAAQEIYASGTSMIGNVGVVGSAPGFLIPSESEYETGPQKVTGFSKRLFPYNLSHALDSFVGAVYEGRGEVLNITASELKSGKIWLGLEALSKGLVDGMGSLQVASSRAARLAGITTYEVRKLNSDEVKGEGTEEGLTGLGELSMDELNRFNPPPAIYYLYLPSQAYNTQAEINMTAPSENRTQKIGGEGQVLVDLSHGNKVSPWNFDMLQAQLSGRGVTVSYSGDWADIEDALNSASCLIIAAPTRHYNFSEYRKILDFVNDGKLLLLFYDPSIEFNAVPELNGPVNSLAKYWGFHFGKGYLYNQLENYGIYRNIYIKEFENKSLSDGLESIVFFTSTYLHPTDSDAGYASAGTFNSVSERMQKYAPFAVLEKGNGTVACFGDITWMEEPYVYIGDNMGLLMNIVEFLTPQDTS